jgi:hypothetical protein
MGPNVEREEIQRVSSPAKEGHAAMQPHPETPRLIGKVLRQHLPLHHQLPPDLQALLLRLALLETERSHYGGRNQRTAA